MSSERECVLPVLSQISETCMLRYIYQKDMCPRADRLKRNLQEPFCPITNVVQHPNFQIYVFFGFGVFFSSTSVHTEKLFQNRITPPEIKITV